MHYANRMWYCGNALLIYSNLSDQISDLLEHLDHSNYGNVSDRPLILMCICVIVRDESLCCFWYLINSKFHVLYDNINLSAVQVLFIFFVIMDIAE